MFRLISKLRAAVHNWYQCLPKLSKNVRAAIAGEVDCVDMSLKILTWLGFWSPPVSGHQQRRWLPRILVIQLGLIAFVLCPVSIYQFGKDTLNTHMGSIETIFIMGLGLSEVVTLLYRPNRFQEMLNAMQEVNAFRHQLALSARSAKRFKAMSQLIVLRMISVSASVLLISLFALPYYFRHRTFPYEYWYPYDFEKSPFFELTFTILVTSLLSTFILDIVFNALLAACLLHAIRHFSLLNVNLSSIFSTPEESLTDDARFAVEGVDAVTADKETQLSAESSTQGSPVADVSDAYSGLSDVEQTSARLQTCINHHVAINRFVKTLTVAFDLHLAQQYITTVFPATLGILHFTNNSADNIKLMMIFALVVTATMNQAVICWLCEQLKKESSSIGLAAYASEWLAVDERFKGALRVIMARCTRPLVVRVANFIPMTLETFHQMTKMTYSYYMFLATTTDTPSK